MTARLCNDEYWRVISCGPLTLLDQLPINLNDYPFIENVDCIDSNQFSIDEQTDKISSSPEADQYSIKASSTHSPQTEAQLLELSCSVCGAPAHGYNFDQITCESCKAFFRRNALKNTSKLKCRFAGDCVINTLTRRQCTYCRLKKCFNVNMRKEWIRTEEERELRVLKNLQKEQKKLNKISSNPQPIVALPIVMRKKKRIILPMSQTLVIQRVEPMSTIRPFGIHRNLSNHDTILLNNIFSAHKYGAEQADSSHIARYTSSATLSQFLNDESRNHQSLIYFYKHIPEFKQFHIDDQILLIKYNMHDIILLHLTLIQNFQEPPQIGIHMSKWISEDFHKQMSRGRHQFDRFMKYPLVLQIALIVFIFTINLNIPHSSNQSVEYRNRRNLYEKQNLYISLLWRYLNYIFDEKEAIRSLQVIVMQILRFQLLMNTMDSILQQNGKENIFDPLMRSVLRLT